MESKSQFIVANTAESSVGRMQAEHIIPVFAKDNEVAISHHEFVQQCYDAVQHLGFHRFLLLDMTSAMYKALMVPPSM